MDLCGLCLLSLRYEWRRLVAHASAGPALCPSRLDDSYMSPALASSVIQSSGAVSKSRWPSWVFRPNEPYGFRGRKAILNRASALVTICP